MKRRGFLAALASAAGAFALDPERALWVPGAKVVSVPAPVAPVQFGVSFSFDPAITLRLDEFQKRYMDPAMIALAHRIDSRQIRRYSLETPAKREWIASPSMVDTVPFRGANARRMFGQDNATGKGYAVIDVMVRPA